MTPTTRRYPRTLNEAFGPYASGPIHDPDKARHALIKAGLIAAGIIAEIAIIVLFAINNFTR
jgi:hypothetical protein